jgi:hypothetical protein
MARRCWRSCACDADTYPVVAAGQRPYAQTGRTHPAGRPRQRHPSGSGSVGDRCRTTSRIVNLARPHALGWCRASPNERTALCDPKSFSSTAPSPTPRTGTWRRDVPDHREQCACGGSNRKNLRGARSSAPDGGGGQRTGRGTSDPPRGSRVCERAGRRKRGFRPLGVHPGDHRRSVMTDVEIEFAPTVEATLVYKRGLPAPPTRRQRRCRRRRSRP